MTPQEKASRTALIVSATLYIASLIAPTLCTAGECGSSGWSLLIVGWLGLLAVPQAVAHLAWLANPVFFGAWLTIWLRRGLLGGVLAFGAFLLTIMPLFFADLVVNEAGTTLPITGYQIGYWLWVSAMIVVGVAAGLLAERT